MFFDRFDQVRKKSVTWGKAVVYAQSSLIRYHHPAMIGILLDLPDAEMKVFPLSCYPSFMGAKR